MSGGRPLKRIVIYIYDFPPIMNESIYLTIGLDPRYGTLYSSGDRLYRFCEEILQQHLHNIDRFILVHLTQNTTSHHV